MITYVEFAELDEAGQTEAIRNLAAEIDLDRLAGKSTAIIAAKRYRLGIYWGIMAGEPVPMFADYLVQELLKLDEAPHA